MKLFSMIILFLLLISFVSSSEYQLKKASELQVGDIIVNSAGEEIIVEKIESPGRVQESYTYESSKSIMDVFWDKIKEDSLPDKVVSGGNSEKGLSLGETGVGIKINGNESFNQSSMEQVKTKNSWLNRLMFWRSK